MTDVPSASLKDFATALRVLSIDMIEKAQSGHPGLPLGFADVMAVLWAKHMRFSPHQPSWAARDRFVLSAGHGSALVYALHFLIGTHGACIDDLKHFRQWQSLTPGHPEYGHCHGIETTTGPLGQGLANAVGMAIAEERLATEFPNANLRHRTFVMVGDGCLMEGLSQEALSLAGHLRLNHLTVLFDDNQISIDGPTSLTHSDDTLKRLEAMGWSTQSIDGHDPAAIDQALKAAKISNKPSFIACRTTIGKFAPTKAGKAAVHGSPLGPVEAEATRRALGWEHPPFFIPAGIKTAIEGLFQERNAEAKRWNESTAQQQHHPEIARRLTHTITDAALVCLDELRKTWHKTPVNLATRQASLHVLEAVSSHMPELLGGSADLTPSNNTRTQNQGLFTADHRAGSYLHYGVREHAMAAIMNGMALHGGVRPYGGTFLVFSDYARPAIRLAALMKLPVTFVMTHDSIGLGEDGPTHQPIEHLTSLRLIPDLLVLRPADAIETAECWTIALQSKNKPSLLALSRQALPSLRHTLPPEENLSARGGYTLRESTETRQMTLMATGSEVSLACEAQEILLKEGIFAAVVSLPCWSLFLEQSEAYRHSVIPPSLPTLSVEAGATLGWERFQGSRHVSLGLDHFGASAPGPVLYEKFDLTPQHIADQARKLLSHHS